MGERLTEPEYVILSEWESETFGDTFDVVAMDALYHAVERILAARAAQGSDLAAKVDFDYTEADLRERHPDRPGRRGIPASQASDLCSQCGERPSVMVKIGTTDGWCTACLDFTAESDLAAKVAAYRDTLARSDREYMRLHARSPKIALATVIDRLSALLADPVDTGDGSGT